MVRPVSPYLGGFLVVFAACAVVRPGAFAQSVASRVESETSGRVVLAFAFDWPADLASQRDSIAHETSGGQLAVALARGSLTASHNVPVGSATGSVISVVSAEFDEIDFSDQPVDSLLRGLAGPVASIVGVGYFRKQLIGSVSVRSVAYDGERGRLRRYRAITVAVDRAPVAKRLDAFSSNPHLIVDESVLSAGTTFKVPINQGGPYRLDQQFLVGIGIDPGSTDPGEVRVFHNGGAALPALNEAPRIADLAEQAVLVTGDGDGSFDAGDAVYFHASGTLSWAYDDTRSEWTHSINPFDRDSYVFVQFGGGANRALNDPEETPGAPTATFSTITGRHVVDFDEFIWSKEHGSGHTWVSNPIRIGGRLDVFTSTTLPGATPGTYSYRSRVAVRSNPAAFFAFRSGAATVASARAAYAVSASPDQPTAAPTETVFTQQLSGSQISLSVELEGSQSNDPQLALDWLRVFYPRQLSAQDGQLRWHSGVDAGLIEHELSGFAGEPIVLDVTDPGDVSRLPVWARSSGYYTQVNVEAGNPRELLAFEPAVARPLDAATAQPVPAQNLHGISSYPDFVIVTAPVLADAAHELADHRRMDGLVVEVVEVDQIYNEFSGGQKDMRAVRDYFKFLYDRAPDEASMLRYVLLFGDGHFDYRNLRADVEQAPNLVLPHETEETFNPDASFSSDDYFGLLDDSEGLWIYRGYSVSSAERVDIGVGRIPVQTLDQARVVVNKIKRYDDPATHGPWRARYTYVADDAFTGANGGDAEGDLHLYNMDSVAEYVKQNVYAGINPQKIYAESFDRVFTNEFRIPGAKSQILDAIDEGTVVLNYMGHGGPRGLAQEDLFTYSDAVELTNGDRLPVFITATCSFGWWDIDDAESGAEALLLNSEGGAAAMFTTVRLVYTSPSPADLNPGLNRALNVALFRRDESGQFARFGDVMVETKNTSVGVLGNSRKFNLLGDPTMRIGVPARQIRIDSINGVDLDAELGQARALDRLTIEGSVVDGSGNTETSFSGSVNVTVYDSERRVPIEFWRWMPNPYYTVREDLLWRGNVGVADGQFSATFVVPKDVSYSNDAGKVSAYATGSGYHALGYTERFLVGGTSSTPPDDSDGPQLRLFLNDTTFVSGGFTNGDPELIVKLFDESGINTVGAGVGHEMLVVIDGDESSAIDLASSFESEEGSYQRGEVRHVLSELNTGPGSLTVRAWDVLNNSASEALEYFVSDAEDLSIRNVYNYPNPMSSRTRFIFEHNQPPGTAADVQIRVYTLNGRVVRTIPSEEALPSGVLTAGPIRVEWDGLDDDLDRLASGVYLYKVRLETDTASGSSQIAERIERLALIR